MEKFYWMDSPDPSQGLKLTAFFEGEPQNQGEALHCPACGECISSLRWLPPFRVELETSEKGFGDFAFANGGGKRILISQSFADLCSVQGVKGLSGFEPVEVVHVKKHQNFDGGPPAYLHVEIAHSRAAIDLQASGYEFESGTPCPECRRARIVKRWRRVLFEPGTWSGEDIFYPRGPGGIFCTRRFRVLCEKHGITGATFLPAEQYSRDFYPWETQKGE